MHLRQQERRAAPPARRARARRPARAAASAVLLAALALCACDAGDPPAPAAAARVPAARDTAGFPRALELPGGGRLVIPSEPRRIVPSSARAIDVLAALVAPERVAGIPEQALEYATLAEDEARFRDLPRFDVYLAEPILALRPDLVLADPWQAPETNARLRGAGVAVLVLPDLVDWPQARAVLELVGRALGAERRAAQVIEEYDARVAALRARAREGSRPSAVAYSNFGAQGYTAGSGTTVHAMFELAGLENAAARAGRVGHGTIGFEELIALDPDVIVVSEPLHAPAGPAGDRGGASGRVLRGEPALASLRAVREDRIVALPAGLYASASHKIVDGAELLAREVERALSLGEPTAAGGGR